MSLDCMRNCGRGPVIRLVSSRRYVVSMMAPGSLTIRRERTPLVSVPAVPRTGPPPDHKGKITLNPEFCVATGPLLQRIAEGGNCVILINLNRSPSTNVKTN